ncbi:CANB [Hepatospora eriocheir]|uniref:Calcineurin subunit B n=1 Tax=Hepatospora eriocheir TaxID=1081669 RepID=A0A1X0QCE8_9MICR|nr:CANB [Hepatospora eriocheir]
MVKIPEEKKSKYVKRSTLQSISTLKNNPLGNIIIKKYSVGTRVNIVKLSEDLSKFLSPDNIEFKKKFFFDIYDQDGDGFISNIDLFEILKHLNSNTLEDYKIQNIVDQTFAEIGEYTTKMSFNQFETILNRSLDDFDKVL